jgi:hypothetical protein
MTEILKILPVFISCAFFGKVGMLGAVALFNFNFWKAMAVSISGGVTGSIVFTYMSDVLIKWTKRIKLKYFKTHKHPKIFTRKNRIIIKVKKRFGLYGVAFLAPILISIPVGAFLGDRFFRNKKKVILALSVAVVFWSLALYFLFLFFFEATMKVI